MKYLLVFILLFSTVQAQTNWKAIGIKSALMFTAGFADGVAEQIRIDYSQFKRTHPNANDQFWNPNKSWINKYADGLQPYEVQWYHFGNAPYYKERFPFSSTIFVNTTDGYHLARSYRNFAMITAIVVPINGKKNFKQYAIEAIAYFVSYGAGFTLSYDVIYK